LIKAEIKNAGITLPYDTQVANFQKKERHSTIAEQNGHPIA
jgi:hypothetical protein